MSASEHTNANCEHFQERQDILNNTLYGSNETSSRFKELHPVEQLKPHKENRNGAQHRQSHWVHIAVIHCHQNGVHK